MEMKKGQNLVNIDFAHRSLEARAGVSVKAILITIAPNAMSTLFLGLFLTSLALSVSQ